jgi:hypothetical protein
MMEKEKKGEQPIGCQPFEPALEMCLLFGGQIASLSFLSFFSCFLLPASNRLLQGNKQRDLLMSVASRVKEMA